ncbi:large ribosomal subunit protein mL54 [Helicoverpa armigera]|uniref:large ribosomal subunit protein mL54 n=1 Tax=Helicoverpa armigera TaxID=29058 RepID=UPI0021136BE1|nr:39S ribosomal protein L54, mitochondrial [Helicoverpa armigera]
MLLGLLRMTLRAACIAQSPQLHTTAASYAAVKKTTSAAGGVMGLGKGKKKAGKLTAMEKKEMPVESDPQRLVSHVCGSNIYTTGEDIKVQEDSAYPAWLWSLPVGRAPPLAELSPLDKRYWLRVRAAGMRRNNKLRSMRRF